MSFADFFPESAGNIDINRFSPESLAFLDYKQELELKNNALKALLAEGKIKAPLLPVVPSPMPRNYRTTGKRRVSYANGKLFFHGKAPVAKSVLEAPAHQEIYDFCHRKFSLPRHKAAATALNYIIIRGSYTEHAVIFNVKRLNGDIVRSLRSVAEEAVENIPALRSGFA